MDYVVKRNASRSAEEQSLDKPALDKSKYFFHQQRTSNISLYVPINNVNYSFFQEHNLLFETKILKDIRDNLNYSIDFIEVEKVFPMGRPLKYDSKSALEKLYKQTDWYPWSQDEDFVGMLAVVVLMPYRNTSNSRALARRVFLKLTDAQSPQGTRFPVPNLNNLPDEARIDPKLTISVSLRHPGGMVQYDGQFVNDEKAVGTVKQILEQTTKATEKVSKLKDVLEGLKGQISRYREIEKQERVKEEAEQKKGGAVREQKVKLDEFKAKSDERDRKYAAQERTTKAKQAEEDTKVREKERLAEERDKKEEKSKKDALTSQEENKKADDRDRREKLQQERMKVYEAENKKVEETNKEQLQKSGESSQKERRESHNKQLNAQAEENAKLESKHQVKTQRLAQEQKEKTEEDKQRDSERSNKKKAEEDKKSAERKVVADEATEKRTRATVALEVSRRARALRNETVAGFAQTLKAKEQAVVDATKRLEQAKKVASAGHVNVMAASAKYESVAADFRHLEEDVDVQREQQQESIKLLSAKQQDDKFETANKALQIVGEAKNQAKELLDKAIDQIKQLQDGLSQRVLDKQTTMKENLQRDAAQRIEQAQIDANKWRERLLNDTRKDAEAKEAELVKSTKVNDTSDLARLLPVLSSGVPNLMCGPVEPSIPNLISRWDFDSDLKDKIGPLDAKIVTGSSGSVTFERGGVRIRNGGYLRTDPLPVALTAKTLEVWAQIPSNSRDQKGRGVMTLQSLDGAVFDGISYAENSGQKWIATSEYWRRTDTDRESEAPQEWVFGEWVHLAAVYAADGSVSFFRNGAPYRTAARKADAATFQPQKAFVVFGIKELTGGSEAKGALDGFITEARLYSRALSPAEVALSYRTYQACPKDCRAMWDKNNPAAPFPVDCVRTLYLQSGCDRSGADYANASLDQSPFQKNPATWNSVALGFSRSFLALASDDQAEATKGTCRRRCEEQKSVDLPGGDLKKIDNVGDSGSCCRLCGSTPQCVHWVYSLDEKSCRLKNAQVGQAVPAKGLVSSSLKKGVLAPVVATNLSLQLLGRPGFYVSVGAPMGVATAEQLQRGLAALEKAQSATFRLVPALAFPFDNFVSFESLRFPNHFLCEQSGAVALLPFANNTIYRRTASFKMSTGLRSAPANLAASVASLSSSNRTVTVSFESLSTPGNFLRLSGNQLQVGPYTHSAAEPFVTEATFLPSASLLFASSLKQAEDANAQRVKDIRVASEQTLKKASVEAEQEASRKASEARVANAKAATDEQSNKDSVESVELEIQRRQENTIRERAQSEGDAVIKKAQKLADSEVSKEESVKQKEMTTAAAPLKIERDVSPAKTEVSREKRQYDQAQENAKLADSALQALEKDIANLKTQVELEKLSQQIATPLLLGSYFYPFGGEYAIPQYGTQNGIVFLSGLVRSDTINKSLDQPVAHLPKDLSPSSRLVFGTHTGSGLTVRLDASTNKLIRVAGASEGEWLTLDGLAWSLPLDVLKDQDRTNVLELSPPWTHFAPRFSAAAVRQHGDLCALSGVIRTNDLQTSSWLNVITEQMPRACRPSEKILVSINHHNVTHRIDIFPSGRVEWISGSKVNGWLSLSGVLYFPRSTGLLTLSAGYEAFEKGFRRPTFQKQGNICVLSGLIEVKNPANTRIAQLPRECRPQGRRIFFTYQQTDVASVRLDVFPDGAIIYQKHRPQDFISLDGIFFMVPETKPDEDYLDELAPRSIAVEQLLTGAAPSSGNIARSQGVVFASTEDKTNVAEKLIDGAYGAINGWKPFSDDQYPRFGVSFDKATTVAAVAFGTDNTGKITTGCFDNFTIQYSTVQGANLKTSSVAWITLGVVDVNPSNVKDHAPCRRHVYLLKPFPVSATAVRVLFTKPTISIDEFEVYSQPPPSLRYVSGLIGGGFRPRNLAALVGTAFASSVAPNTKLEALNDQQYGSKSTWSPQSDKPLRNLHFAGVSFKSAVELRSLAFSRNNRYPVPIDFAPGLFQPDEIPVEEAYAATNRYTVQFTTVENPNADTLEQNWRPLGFLPYADLFDSFKPGTAGGKGITDPGRRHVFNLPRPVNATGVRILLANANTAASIDELEIYDSAFPSVSVPAGQFGGTFQEGNLARSQGAAAFASSALKDGTYAVANLADGSYGDASSWRPDPAKPLNKKHFAGVRFSPTSISSIAFGRDNTNGYADRTTGIYTLQYSPVPADEKVPDEMWITLGSLEVSRNTLSEPHRRHVYTLSQPVRAAAVRVLLSGPNLSIDEIEVYSAKLDA